MAKIRKSVRLNAPVDQVFDYITHPENLPEIWPSMVEVSNVKRKSDGAHSFDWVYKMAGVRFKGHAESIEIETNARSVVKNERGIPSTFHWTFEGANGGTRVTMEVEYTIPGKLLDKLVAPLVERLNDREAESVLENLKTRLELGRAPVKRRAHARPH